MFVDNVYSLSTSAAGMQRAHAHICAALGTKSLLLHEHVVSVPELEAVGLLIDGRRRQLRRKTHKTWLLHAATEELLRGVPLTGRGLRAYVGHVMNQLIIVRHALSIVSELYKLIGDPDARVQLNAKA